MVTRQPFARIRRGAGAVGLLGVILLLAGQSARADEFDLPPALDEPATPAPAPRDAGTADEAFDLKIKTLEEKVNDLKEKTFRTKHRLDSLAEAVLGAPRGGAKLAIGHRNELGSTYVVTALTVTLDGAPLFTKVDESGALNAQEELVVFDQRIVPGQHQISVQYELRGHGYGIFSYLEGMRVKLRSSYQFDVEPGKLTQINAVVYEKDGITLEFKDKPDIKYVKTVTKDLAKPADTGGQPQARAGTREQ